MDAENRFDFTATCEKSSHECDGVPMNRLPSLNALRTFEAAARHETLMQAAEELHVTHGAVSRQVRALEQDLGEELFERSGRGKVPTERAYSGRKASGYFPRSSAHAGRIQAR
jgi:hypothetical protein